MGNQNKFSLYFRMRCEALNEYYTKSVTIIDDITKLDKSNAIYTTHIFLN